ncbi:MAG: MFS transporter [Proteobacteria bacterium]|nr:MFS transporter [Pseudomonadota bacterium]
MQKKIYFLWFGQMLSWTGSSMSFFGLGVWIFELTGNATALSSILFTVAIVGTITGPFGGVIADRFPRKRVIITFDGIILLVMCFIGYLALNDQLTVGRLIPFALAFGIFEIAHWSTWQAFLGDVVKKENLTKAAALFESAGAISMLLGPIGGAFIYASSGLVGVIIVDAATFLVGITSIIFIKTPVFEKRDKLTFKNVLVDLKEGFLWVKNQKGLRTLVTIFAISNFAHGMISTILTPLVLNFADEKALGLVNSTFGATFLLGSAISVRVSKRIQGNMKYVLLCGIFMSLAMMFGSIRPSVFVLITWIAIEGICGTIQYTISSGAWLTLTDEKIRGRAMAFRGTIAQSLRPIGILIAGPLGDYLEFDFYDKYRTALEPFFGTGNGRGYAIVLFLGGLLLLFVYGINYKNQNLIKLQNQVEESIKNSKI